LNSHNIQNKNVKFIEAKRMEGEEKHSESRKKKENERQKNREK